MSNLSRSRSNQNLKPCAGHLHFSTSSWCIVMTLGEGYCTNELTGQRSLIYWGFQVKWGSRLIRRLIRATETIGSRETDLRRVNVISRSLAAPTLMAYCFYRCHVSFALRPVNKKTKPVLLHGFVIQTDLQAELHKEWIMTTMEQSLPGQSLSSTL